MLKRILRHTSRKKDFLFDKIQFLYIARLILIPIKNQTSLCPTILPTVSIRPNVPNWYVSSSFPCRKKFGSQTLSDFQQGLV